MVHRRRQQATGTCCPASWLSMQFRGQFCTECCRGALSATGGAESRRRARGRRGKATWDLGLLAQRIHRYSRSSARSLHGAGSRMASGSLSGSFALLLGTHDDVPSQAHPRPHPQQPSHGYPAPLH